MSEIKTCRNCGYNNGLDKCLRSDLSIQKTKLWEFGCDVDFSGWKKIPQVEIKNITDKEIETISNNFKIVK